MERPGGPPPLIRFLPVTAVPEPADTALPHQAVSRSWRTTGTLARWRRISRYLDPAATTA